MTRPHTQRRRASGLGTLVLGSLLAQGCDYFPRYEEGVITHMSGNTLTEEELLAREEQTLTLKVRSSGEVYELHLQPGKYQSLPFLAQTLAVGDTITYKTNTREGWKEISIFDEERVGTLPADELYNIRKKR
jgi:hypothetical protein